MGVSLTAEQIIDKYADMVYRLALTEVKNQTDADDIFQEVFLRLVKNLHKLENEEHVKAWLIRVTVNCSKSYLGNFWNRNVDAIPEDTQIGRESEELEALINGEGSVTAAVRKLPPKYRVVVHLFYFEDLSVQEIAKSLKMGESTVKSQLHRARKQLKELLEDVDL